MNTPAQGEVQMAEEYQRKILYAY